MRQRVKTGSFADFLELVRKSRREAALVGAAALILVSLTAFSFWLTHRVLKDFETADELNAIQRQTDKILSNSCALSKAASAVILLRARRTFSILM